MRSPVGRQVSVGEALNRAARGSHATARKLEDSFAGSAVVSSPAAVPQAAASSSAAPQAARAGGDIVLPSYLQAALAAADGCVTASVAAAPVHVELRSANLHQHSEARPADGMLQPAADRAEKRKLTDIERLPPVSQLDASVLDALPLHVRRELEMAYGAPDRPSSVHDCSHHPAAVWHAGAFSDHPSLSPCRVWRRHWCTPGRVEGEARQDREQPVPAAASGYASQSAASERTAASQVLHPCCVQHSGL